MKRTLVISFVALVAFAGCQKKSFDQQVQEETIKFNETEAPRQVDECTILDSMSYNMKSRTLTFHHTIFGTADNAALLTDDVRKQFREQLSSNMRNSIQLKAYKEQGITFRYRYMSKKNGKLLISEQFIEGEY